MQTTAKMIPHLRMETVKHYTLSGGTNPFSQIDEYTLLGTVCTFKVAYNIFRLNFM